LPELPEVETVRRGLEALYVGRRLLSLEVSGRRTVRRHPPQLLDRLAGSVLVGASRHGKYLLLRWNGRRALVVHLRMSGQLRVAEPRSPLAPHTHAVFRFVDAPELRFVDPRTFGELFLAGAGRPLPAELSHLGTDALQAGVADVAAITRGRKAPLKALLTDQQLIAGVGNIYADEVCFSAGLRPDRPAGSLSQGEVRRLAVSLGRVLEAAIAAGGSTLADRRYLDVQGAAGSYQLEHKVYGRAGHACLRCGGVVQKLKIGAKSAYACLNCQR